MSVDESLNKLSPHSHLLYVYEITYFKDLRGNSLVTNPFPSVFKHLLLIKIIEKPVENIPFGFCYIIQLPKTYVMFVDSTPPYNTFLYNRKQHLATYKRKYLSIYCSYYQALEVETHRTSRYWNAILFTDNQAISLE